MYLLKCIVCESEHEASVWDLNSTRQSHSSDDDNDATPIIPNKITATIRKLIDAEKMKNKILRLYAEDVQIENKHRDKLKSIPPTSTTTAHEHVAVDWFLKWSDVYPVW